MYLLLNIVMQIFIVFNNTNSNNNNNILEHNILS